VRGIEAVGENAQVVRRFVFPLGPRENSGGLLFIGRGDKGSGGEGAEKAENEYEKQLIIHASLQHLRQLQKQVYYRHKTLCGLGR
jgi:hypothetical protein